MSARDLSTADDDALLAAVGGMFDDVDPAPAHAVDGCADLTALASRSAAAPPAPGVASLPRPGVAAATAGPDGALLIFPDGYTPSANYTFWQCGANMRANRWAKATITAQIRGDACQLARSQRLPHFTVPVTVSAVQHPAKGRRAHDSENIAPLVKAAIDGLRDANVLINDSPRWVKRVAYEVGERTERGQLVLHITPVDGAR